MGWVTYGEWHCIYADEPVDRLHIKLNVPRGNTEFKNTKGYNYLGFPKSMPSARDRACVLSERGCVLVTVKNSKHIFGASTEKSEKDFQMKGKTEIYVVADFTEDKATFQRGDIIAVFTERKDYLDHPKTPFYEFGDMIAFSLKNIFASGHRIKTATDIFPGLIRQEIKRIDDEAAAERARAQRAAQAAREREIERQRQEEAAANAELRNFKMRIEEMERQAEIETQAAVKRFEAEIEAARAETDQMERRARLKIEAQEEEARITAEVLELRKQLSQYEREELTAVIEPFIELMRGSRNDRDKLDAAAVLGGKVAEFKRLRG